MKKFLALLLVLMFVFVGCANNSGNEVENTDNSQETVLADKVNDTAYAGRVTEITDKTITIIMDETVSETFNLNEKAKKDIEVLKVEVDKRVVINFDTVENREITSIEVELVR